MSLVDKIEEYGAAVDAGLLGRDEAARSLATYSDGGLTVDGAARALDRWQGVRAAYREEFDEASSFVGIPMTDHPEEGNR